MADNLMKVSIQDKAGGIKLVFVKGEVDLSTSPGLRSKILELFKGETPKTILIDLQEVVHMDSSGIATLVEGLQASRKNNSAFVLCGVAGVVKSVFEIANLDKVFEIYENQDAALSAITK